MVSENGDYPIEEDNVVSDAIEEEKKRKQRNYHQQQQHQHLGHFYISNLKLANGRFSSVLGRMTKVAPDSHSSDSNNNNNTSTITIMLDNSAKTKQQQQQQRQHQDNNDRFTCQQLPDQSLNQNLQCSSMDDAYGNEQKQQQQQDHQNSSSNRRTSISQRIKTVVQRAFKKESKLDNLEAIINDSALKLLQQKEIIFKQNTLQLEALCKKTRFSKRELKWLYSGWKVACTDGYGCGPEGCTGETYGSLSLSSAYYGIINENQFQQIYSQFFPYGGDCTFYAKYVFQTMFGEALIRNGGFITFTDYALSLSNLLRGSIDDKINFVFRLYDLNNDNVLTIDEISRIFFAMYRLLGDNVDIKHDQATYEAQASKLFDKIDLEGCGFITQEQFFNYCKKDDTIVKTIKTLEMSIISNA